MIRAEEVCLAAKRVVVSDSVAMMRARARGALLTVAALVLAAGCAGRPVPAENPSPPVTLSPAPTQFLEMTGSRLVGTDAQGRKVWEVEARGVVVDDSQKNVILERPSGRFFIEDGQVVRFEAARARYNIPDRVMTLEGGVRVVAASDRWFSSDRVTYAAAQHQFTAAGSVRFRYGTMTLRGGELRADVALRRAHLIGAVQASVQEGEQP
jgi:LPS export ABC transporter protein LptC